MQESGRESVSNDGHFRFATPMTVFEKSDASTGQTRRIAGIISTEVKDRQGDLVIQKGLDFTEFLDFGWFNDNHSRETTSILGYPDYVEQFAKGDRLPDGSLAKADCTWAEGWLLETQKANEIWELGKALSQTNRRLGYSVEGKIERRTGADRKTIAKAIVREVAITKAPVNTDTHLEILAKAIVDENEAIEKALAMGTVSSNATPVGPQTGAGAGQVLSPESLETDERIALMVDEAESLSRVSMRKSIN